MPELQFEWDSHKAQINLEKHRVSLQRRVVFFTMKTHYNSTIQIIPMMMTASSCWV